LQEARYKDYTAKRRTVSFGSPDPPGFLLPLQAKTAAWLRVPAAKLKHVLIAEYRPGSALGWHRDVPDFAHSIPPTKVLRYSVTFRTLA
jgi:alkylated DNA repair dioxygenase AlkB